MGDLVYIKHEKQKHKLRDRYIITKINKDKAVLQKLNQKFMSRQYEVPLSDIYPVWPSLPIVIADHQPDETSSDESSDELSLDEHEGNEQESDHAEEDEEEEEARETDGSSLPTASPSAPSSLASGRSQRQRKEPQWMRSGEYDLT